MPTSTGPRSSFPSARASVERRAEELYVEQQDTMYRWTDRLMGWLFLAQWVFGIVLALLVSPRAWSGTMSGTHVHVYGAVGVGFVINAVPWLLIKLRPGALVTRAAVGCAQLAWSGLLIHLTGGRIETHFHVFGSLAIIAIYRDYRIMIPATVVTALDHFVRGVAWPESIYGVTNPAWWRFLEHAGWVVFTDVFLIMACLKSDREMKVIALARAENEELAQSEKEKAEALEVALRELADKQEALVRNERLAAVGQLAAGVGHELRNPLAAVRNAHTYIAKKQVAAKQTGANLATDTRVEQFMGVIDRELDACSKIISDLLDFARGKAPTVGPVSLATVVDAAIEIVPRRAGVALRNEVSPELELALVDKDQFRQVFVNLVQNASEAFDDGQGGSVVVSGARAAGDGGFVIRVKDDGPGMAPEVSARVFQPLYSTKTKGTGLGLAIVQGVVERHGGNIRLESELGRGTEFVIELPASAVQGERKAAS